MIESPTPERLRHLLSTFEALLDLDPPARDRRLAELEREDPEAAADLQAMLRADGPGEELELELRLGEPRDSDDDADPIAAGTEIGCYRVVRRLGRGGMGEVYLASRTHQGFERPVALKLLRRELVGPHSVERFHRECRIQARLDHPAIVPLIDVGVAPDGRPFLVLQYVEGLPVTAYADRHRLTIVERLRLVVACCRAVESAHSRLVVHRDLKPSNILVGEGGEVRLLDFGIAKVLGEDEEHELTRQAPAPMTPERAAPEQLRGEPSSTATDVWGLGVLLYQLATGRLPFEVRRRTPREIEREIRERGPTRPSRALPQGADEAARAAREALAWARSTTGRRLARDLGGDLEVVVARALAAEPERRYPSAAAFGDDVERLLAGRPVAARADSIGYRARRFAGRHRVGVTAAAVAVAGLAALTVATAVQSVRVASERDRATALEKQSTAVANLLTELFGATSPNRGAGVGNVSIDQLLDQGAAKAEAMTDSPGVRQRMFATLGRIRLERSELPQGRALLERARAVADEASVAALDPDRLALELDYTGALARMDDGDAARALLEPLAARLDGAGERYRAELAEALAQLALVVPAEEGPPLAERSLAIRRRLDPVRPVDLAASLDALGNLAFRRGDHALARQRWQESLPILEREVGEEDLRTLSTLNNLAVVTVDAAEQLALLRRLLVVQQRLLGPDAGPVANTWNNIGVALVVLGDYPEAERALRESHRLRGAVLGLDHRETVRTLRNVARVVELRGRYVEALALFDEVLARLPATGVPPATWPGFRRPARGRPLADGASPCRAHRDRAGGRRSPRRPTAGARRDLVRPADGGADGDGRRRRADRRRPLPRGLRGARGAACPRLTPSSPRRGPSWGGRSSSPASRSRAGSSSAPPSPTSKTGDCSTPTTAPPCAPRSGREAKRTGGERTSRKDFRTCCCHLHRSRLGAWSWLSRMSPKILSLFHSPGSKAELRQGGLSHTSSQEFG